MKAFVLLFQPDLLALAVKGGLIDAQDFGVVRAMTYLGSVLFIAGLILTDISYTLVDPRVRLE